MGMIDSAQRCYMGLSSQSSVDQSALEEVLGKAKSPEREAWVSGVEAKLGHPLSDGQREFLLSWAKSVGVLHCVPGAVKVMQHQGAYNIRLIITEPKQGNV